MNFSVNFPLFSIILCLLCSVISSILSEKRARLLSLALCLAVCLMSLCLLGHGIATGTETSYIMGHHPHPWGNEIRFGILEPMLVSLFSFIMFLSLIGGERQLARDLHEGKQNLYYVLTDLILVALTALTYTNDIFTGYVFVEICTISSCGILMIREIGRTTLAAIRYMIFSLIGSGLFLLGTILLYGITGQLLMPDLKAAIALLWESGSFHTQLITAICLISSGLAIKSGLFPFHLWMPDTYGYSTPCSSCILSGLVSKGYIVLLIKAIFCVFGTGVFYSSGMQNVFFGLGILGMVFGSLSAIKENDIFRMSAYSSAAQIGYIYMGIGISPTTGMAAAVFHIMTHAITKPLIFLSAAQLSDAAGGKHFKDLQGIGHTAHLAGGAFTIGALSMVGIPFTMGFISKYLFAVSAFRTDEKCPLILAALAVSTLLNVYYFMRTVIRLYQPAAPDEAAPESRVHTPSLPYMASAVIMIIMNIGGGIFSRMFIEWINAGLGML